MSRKKVSNEIIYQELNNLTNLYYHNCSIKELLKYISDTATLSVILTTSSFGVISTYFSEEQMAELSVDQIVPLYTTPGESDIIPFEIAGKLSVYLTLQLPDGKHYLCIESRYVHIDNYRKLIIKNDLPFLALLLEKRKLEQFNQKSSHFRPFFQIFKDNASQNPESIQQICRHYQFDYTLKRVCMTVQIQTKITPDELKKLSKIIAKQLCDHKIFLIYEDNLICAFFLFPPSHQELDAITQAYMASIALFEQIKATAEIRIGISCAHAGVETLYLSYKESMQSIEVQKQLRLPCCASSYYEQTIFHLLNIPQLSYFRNLAHDILLPLIQYDTENHTNYYQILQAYFRNNFNIQKTAKELFIHRNTLSYRLQHLKELLKFDFDFEHNIDALFTLYLCICVHELGYFKSPTANP